MTGVTVLAVIVGVMFMWSAIMTIMVVGNRNALHNVRDYINSQEKGREEMIKIMKMVDKGTTEEEDKRVVFMKSGTEA